MRVSQKLMADSVTANLFRSTERLLKTENMISSGKAVSKPSDDPVAAAAILGFRETLDSVDQYRRNIDQGETWLSVSDSTLASVNTVLIRAQEIASSQSTGTASAETRKMAAEEIEAIFQQVMQLANTKVGNRYLFGGFKNDSPPFESDGMDMEYSGDDGELSIIAGDNVRIAINLNGEEIFLDNGSGNGIFDVLKTLKEGLENNDPDAVSAQAARLGDCLDNVLKGRSTVGARLNRLESTSVYWDDFELKIQELLSGAEDADLIKLMTDLSTQEAAYQASLTAAARMIQPSLAQYL
jgi:flagellar hook-associated protein 3 FlgL